MGAALSTEACATFGNSSTEGLVSAIAYDESITRIVEDILLSASEGISLVCYVFHLKKYRYNHEGNEHDTIVGYHG